MMRKINIYIRGVPALVFAGMAFALAVFAGNPAWSQIADVLAAEISPGQKVYRIGILANRGEQECVRRWQPTVNYLNRTITGLEFRIVPLAFSEFTNAIRNGKVDFFLGTPVSYVEMDIEGRCFPLLTLEESALEKSSAWYGGVVFTRADRRDINTFKDLKGKNVLAADPESLAWLAAWREMRKSGIEPQRHFRALKFGNGNHDDTVRQVLNGEVDVGCTRTMILETMAAEGKINLKDVKVLNSQKNKPYSEKFPFLHSTPLYPNWPLAAMNSVNRRVAERVMMELLGIEPDGLSAVIGRYSRWTTALNYQGVQDVLRYLRFGPFKDYGKITLRGIWEQYNIWIMAVLSLFAVLVFLALRITMLYQYLYSTQEAVRKSERRFRGLFEHMASGVIVFEAIRSGTDFIVREMNQAAADICKFRADQAQGKTIEELLPGIKEFGLPALLARVLETGEPAHLPCSFYQDKRINLWVENFVYKLEYNQLVAVFNDITDRKHAQDKISQQAHFLQEILDAVPAPLYYKDADGKYLGCNKVFAEFVGLSREEIIGGDLNMLIDEEEADFFRKKDAELLSAPGRQSFEYWLRLKNGKALDVFFSKAVFRQDNGKVGGIVGVIFDLTERKAMEHRLSEQEQLLRQIINTVPAHIFWKDTNCVFLGCNQMLAQAAGLSSPQEIIGKTDYDLPWTREESDGYRRDDLEVMQKNKAKMEIEEVQHRADGKESYLFTSKVPLRNAQGEVTGLLGVFTDITKLKQMEAELKRSHSALEQMVMDLGEKNKQLKEAQAQLLQTEKMSAVGRLSAGVAHEIKNPLAVILLALESLEEINGLDETIAKKIIMMKSAAERANNVVLTLLNFSRATEVELKPLDLHQVLGSVQALAANTLKLKDVQVEKDLHNGPLPIYGDQILLEQVFLNLFTNAFDAVAEKGRLQVRTYTAMVGGEKAVVEFSDNGQGIAEENLPRIFEPFFTTKDPGKGTGLGLSTVYTILEQHQAKVYVQSKLKEGTKFTVIFPLRKEK